jgi:hypothetical protein
MNADRPAGDLREHGERMGSALVELARQALKAGRLPTVRGEAAQVRVSVDLMALCAERGAPGVAGGEPPSAGPICVETARRLACDAGVVRVLTDAAGLPLDVGREQRTATAAIRRAIEARDGHCVFAGCTAPASWCDVHHVEHWARGGTHLVRKRRAAVRAPPHRRPRGRIHDRPRFGHGDLAHLPARRYGDPCPPAEVPAAAMSRPPRPEEINDQVEAMRSRIAVASWSGACSGIQCVTPGSSTNR